MGADAPAAGAGDIENAGDVDIYTRLQRRPQRAPVRGAGRAVTPDQGGRSCARFNWALKDGAGTVLGHQQLLLRHHRRPGSSTGSGPYTVEVTRHTDTTGSYLMQVLEPVQQPFTIADGASVSPDVPGAGAGRLPGPGDPDLFTLSGPTRRQRVHRPDHGDARPGRRDCSYFAWILRDGAGAAIDRRNLCARAGRSR